MPLNDPLNPKWREIAYARPFGSSRDEMRSSITYVELSNVRSGSLPCDESKHMNILKYAKNRNAISVSMLLPDFRRNRGASKTIALETRARANYEMAVIPSRTLSNLDGVRSMRYT